MRRFELFNDRELRGLHYLLSKNYGVIPEGDSLFGEVLVELNARKALTLSDVAPSAGPDLGQMWARASSAVRW